MRTNCKRNAPTYLLIAFLIMQLNSRHEHRAIEEHARMVTDVEIGEIQVLVHLHCDLEKVRANLTIP